MIKDNISITEYLDTDYHDYAKYVIENRAIPSVIDGLKPTQRKVVYIADKVWKNGSEKPLKIFQLSGKVAADAHYHHGDASLSGSIVGMAQKFKNSMPLLEEIGQFGSMRSPDAGAPRYISTKLHSNFRLLYKDFELLESREEEGNLIEPEYFLPIIPTVLLNGGSGIAVGFATNILNRNPLDLIRACLNILEGKKLKEPKPWYRGFTGNIERDPESGSWVFSGNANIINTTTVKIDELPPSTTYQKYEKHLVALEEAKKLATFDDNCKSNIDYTLRFKRSDLNMLDTDLKLRKFLKLDEKQSENLTMLDEFGKLKIFDNVKDIVEYFVDFRLKFYDKRKSYLIDKLETELMILSNKAEFIKAIVENKLKINNVPKKDIVLYLEVANFDEVNDSYSYLLSMPIHTLTKEKYEELISQVYHKEIELDVIKKTLPMDMYVDDLKKLQKVLIKQDF